MKHYTQLVQIQRYQIYALKKAGQLILGDKHILIMDVVIVETIWVLTGKRYKLAKSRLEFSRFSHDGRVQVCPENALLTGRSGEIQKRIKKQFLFE